MEEREEGLLHVLGRDRRRLDVDHLVLRRELLALRAIHFSPRLLRGSMRKYQSEITQPRGTFDYGKNCRKGCVISVCVAIRIWPSLLYQVAFVADEELGRRGLGLVRELLDLVDPLLQVGEGDGVGDVEDDEDAVRVAVARREHGTVTLLAARVPHLVESW